MDVNTAWICRQLRTFRDNLAVPPSFVKRDPIKVERIGSSETLVTTNPRCVNTPHKRRSYLHTDGSVKSRIANEVHLFTFTFMRSRLLGVTLERHRSQRPDNQHSRKVNLYQNTRGHISENRKFHRHLCDHLSSYLKVKRKAIPLQAWTGPKGSRSLRLPDFKTIGI